MSSYNHNKESHPIFGKTKFLIDRVPFLNEPEKFAEIWEHNIYFLGIRIKRKTVEQVSRIRSSELTMQNNSFDFLRSSNEFLNILLNNINSCILLLNKETRLTAFNDNLKTIFSNKPDENLIYQRCGEAIGCAYNIEERKDCGKTSVCNDCELRNAALNSYNNNENIYKQKIVRPFYNTANQKVLKHLQFSTHLIHYYKDKYVVMLIEDVSQFFEQDSRLQA
ncbi:MAG: hypothetical protein BWY70_01803 [Bacteroidetes bacterium ADurb.Bin408]|nr:MAG: hypothetical protein BWY70_01803 [Bacteroidetes bacterium ADurb.Bin408]